MCTDSIDNRAIETILERELVISKAVSGLKKLFGLGEVMNYEKEDETKKKRNKKKGGRIK